MPELAFEPGTEPGTTDVTVRSEPMKRYDLTASLTNFGTKSTGELQASLFGRVNSLTGVRDTLSFQLQASEGAASGQVGYSRPMGRPGGRLVLSAAYSQSDVISGAFSTLDIVSDSQSAGIAYRWPGYVRPNSHWMFETGFTYDENQSTLGGLPLADVTLTELQARAERVWRGDRQALQLSFGLRVGTAETNQVSQTEGDYWLLEAGLGWNRLIGESALLSVQARAQLAENQNLPVDRLFTVGGPTSVRGYPNNVRAGDSGLEMKIQLDRAQPWNWGRRVSVTPFGFVDAAVVKPFRQGGGFDADQDLLASVGGGVRVGLGKKVAALIFVGVPLVDTLGFDASGEYRVHAGLDWTF